MGRSPIDRANWSSSSVRNRERAADAIVADLRTRIVTGKLVQGTRLPPERDLAEVYGVSGPTVREALQGLSAIGLLDVRHGSGTYVSVHGDTILARSLGTVMQLGKIGQEETMGLLTVLYDYAARLSANRVTGADISALEKPIAELQVANDTESLVKAVRAFNEALCACAHDPLLFVISRFLLNLQLEISLDLSGGSFRSWKRTASTLHPFRLAIVDAMRRRDSDALLASVALYQGCALDLMKPGSVSPEQFERALQKIAELA